MVQYCENGHGAITQKQAEFSEKHFGKPLCPECAAKDSARTAEQYTPQYINLDMVGLLEAAGWTVNGWNAEKDIGDSVSVQIRFKTLPLSVKFKIGSLEYEDYHEGLNNKVDEELLKVQEIVGKASVKKDKSPEKTVKAQESTTERQRNLPAPTQSVRSDTPLSVDTIIKYINPMATEQEAFMFLQLCKERNLNPFLKEAYLIKYSEKDAAAFVVGKYAFTKRADIQPDYKGFKAGIILQDRNGNLERREGSLLLDGEMLIGGWARVFRKEREPYVEEVGLNEYIKKNQQGQPIRSWAAMPATMIRKVALVHALREAYPHEFSGMYDQSEIMEN